MHHAADWLSIDIHIKSKEAGSPFGGSSSMGNMSCYKCGLHKPRSLVIKQYCVTQFVRGLGR